MQGVSAIQHSECSRIFHRNDHIVIPKQSTLFSTVEGYLAAGQTQHLNPRLPVNAPDDCLDECTSLIYGYTPLDIHHVSTCSLVPGFSDDAEVGGNRHGPVWH